MPRESYDFPEAPLTPGILDSNPGALLPGENPVVAVLRRAAIEGRRLAGEIRAHLRSAPPALPSA